MIKINMKKKDIIKLSIATLSLIILLILLIGRETPSFADAYTKTFAALYIETIGKFTSLFPISIFEISFIILIIFLLFLIIRIFGGIKKKKLIWLSRLITLLTFTLLIGTLYVGTAGVSYGRSNPPIPLESNENIDETLIEEALKFYISDYNEIGTHFSRDEKSRIICPYSIEELSNIINDEYDRILSYNDYYSSYRPLAKGLITSQLFSEFHITGITMSLTGEANFNKNISSSELPFTIAHEFAHIKGCYREDDANITAAYICLNSTDEYLRYSGYYWTISSIIDAYNTTFRTSYSEKYPLSKEIKNEWHSIYSYWKELDRLEEFAKWWNDLYLKINGNHNGVDDYQDVSIKEDTGQVDDEGNSIVKITDFSPYQKLLYGIYKKKHLI